MSFNRGDIVIVPFPFVDENGTQEQKARPAQNIQRRYNDKILAGITSRIPKELTKTELPLESNKKTGLAKRSVLRLDYLMTVPVSLISRKIGVTPPEKLHTVDELLALSLGLPID
ncbi:MAG: type II toxin-antitoxin system PemK/MazF family toxin [Candidatus Bipolaricaulia bacterium]